MASALTRCCAHWRLAWGLNWRRSLAVDGPAIDRLVRAMTRADRRFRFHGAVNASPIGLSALAFVAVRLGAQGDEVLAEARMALDPARHSAELALMVDTAWRHCGVGQWCLQQLRHEARRRGVQQLRAAVLADNREMLRLLLRNGFQPLLPGDPGFGGDADGACWLVSPA